MPIRPLIFLFHPPCLPRLRRNVHERILWMRTKLVAMQMGAYREFVNVSSPLHQWRQSVPTKASKMLESLKSRLLLAPAIGQTQGRHPAIRSEHVRSLRSITLLEIYPIADSVELGLSSSLPCALQIAIALILAINRHGCLSPHAGSPAPMTTTQTTLVTVHLPSMRHAKAGIRRPMQQQLLRGQRHEHLWTVSNSE